MSARRISSKASSAPVNRWVGRTVIAVAVALLGACGGNATGSESPTASAAPTGPVVLAVDSPAEVIVSDLVIRSEPSTDDDSIIYDNHLGTGDVVFVTTGPIAASGYDWYEVQPIQRPGAALATELPFGFVPAANAEGEPSLRPLPYECPASPPSLESIIQLSAEERLFCFGGEELTLRGESQGCAIQETVTIEPGWFESLGCLIGTSDRFMQIRLPPEASSQPPAGINEITGHFDDPRAQDCHWVYEGPEIAERPVGQLILRCRTEFVVTSVTPVP